MAASEKICKVRLNLSANSSVPYSQLLDLRSAQSRATVEATADFLKGLPSHDETNFSRFHPDTACKNYMKKTSVYVPTRDHPAEQIITTEKTTILLRYLQQQYDRKRALAKREADTAGPSDDLEQNPRKKTRLQK